MENKNIIIILVAIIVILAAAIGFVLFNPLVAKEPCKVLITSDKEQYEGGELSIILADLNKRRRRTLNHIGRFEQNSNIKRDS